MQAVWIALGGNAAFLIVVAVLGRKLITHWLNKDFERFKERLASSAAIELERLRSELALVTQEHSILLSRLQDRRASVIGELYGMLAAALRLTQAGVHPLQGDKEGDKVPAALEAIRAAQNRFDETQIWLTESCARSVEDLISKTITLYNQYIRYYGLSRVPREPFSSESGPSESWMRAWESLVTNELPTARKALETEMRSLLAPAGGKS